VFFAIQRRSFGAENFIANGEVLVFPGFLSVYDYLSSDDILLPNLNKGDALSIANFTARESFSRAKPRYTEASFWLGTVCFFQHLCFQQGLIQKLHPL
jgi:DNA topoisomerase IA